MNWLILNKGITKLTNRATQLSQVAIEMAQDKGIAHVATEMILNRWPTDTFRSGSQWHETGQKGLLK